MKLLPVFTSALLAAAGLAMAADEAKKPATEGAAEAAPAAGKTVDLEAGPATFKASAPWEAKKKPLMMSAGGFTIPGKDKAAPIEADFYHFGGAAGGGGMEDNVKRWQRQFQPGEDGKLPEPKREELTLGDKKATMVTFKGTFLYGSVMAKERTPMPGFTMVGIIIPYGGEQGSIYIKIAGPEAAMTAAAGDIRKLVGSAFPEKK